MPVALPAQARAVLESGRLHERLLVRMDLTGVSGPATPTSYYFAHDDADITWDGQTWLGMSQIADVGARGFALGTAASGIIIEVRGAGLATPGDPSGAAVLTLAYEEARRGDGVEVLRLHYDPATGTPLFTSPFFIGYLARMRHRRSAAPPGEAGQAVLTLEIENDELMMSRAPGRVRSDADQRRAWPLGGGGFHQVVATAAGGSNVPWGQDAPRQSVASGVVGGGGGGGGGGGRSSFTSPFEGGQYR